MTRPAAFFPIALALGVIILAPWDAVQAQDRREEGPTEIKKCQTIDKPGSYKLVNNLTFSASSGTCLQITAGPVTVDLAGFSISGFGSPGPSTQTTMIGAESGVNGIAVRNGSIFGDGNGVILGGDGSIIEGVRVTRFGGLPATAIAATGIIKNNTVSNLRRGSELPPPGS